MPSYTGVVTVGADDYDDNSSTGTYLNIISNNATSTYYEGYALLDTTEPETGIVVTAATLYWNTSSYTKSRDASYDGNILISNNSGSSYSLIYSFSSAPTISWESHALTSGELSLINTTGKTYFSFVVNNPGSTYYRNWRVRAYEEFPNGEYSVYLAIDYDLPVASRRHRIFVM